MTTSKSPIGESTSVEMPDYGYEDHNFNDAHAYLLPCVRKIIEEVRPSRIFDLGCGNGSVAGSFAHAYDVIGVDASPSGIDQATRNHRGARFALASVYDDLAGTYGQFDAVISLEVVEHLFSPRVYAKRMFDLIRPGGFAIVSTPYHGYLKNVAMALSGKMDNHFTALWDGGHIKFWSVKTLSILLGDAGFMIKRFEFVGRIPPLAKSMVCVAQRPAL